MANNGKRFEVVLKEGTTMEASGLRLILRDKETGVQYLTWHSGYAGGMTVLVDADGKPLIAK